MYQHEIRNDDSDNRNDFDMSANEGLHLSPKSIVAVVGGLITIVVGSNFYTNTVASGASNNTADELRGSVLEILQEDKETFTADEMDEEFQRRDREAQTDQSISALQGDMAGLHVELNNVQGTLATQGGMLYSVMDTLEEIKTEVMEQ